MGHSYGGFLTSNAATGNDRVKALVFVRAFTPDEGESAVQPLIEPPFVALDCRIDYAFYPHFTLGGLDTLPTLPVPMMNILNGGSHADSNV
ncbi:hypothetical protein ABZS63_31820, partial [Streptomyces sp. NPDC005568]